MALIEWPPSKATLTSPAWLFIVGEERTEFHVHRDVVSRLSTTLAPLMHSNMPDVRNGTVILEDVDVDLLACFIQYAYTGDYAEPTAIKHLTCGDTIHADHIDNATVTDVVASDPIEHFAPIKTRKSIRINGMSKRERTIQQFQDQGNVNALPAYQPQSNRVPSDEYTAIFLCHAAMYVFANKYGISCLQELAIYRLRRTLSVFRMYPERVGDVVQLVRYGYSQTSGSGCDKDALRRVISEFVSCHIQLLSQMDCFKEAMRLEGSFACDILHLLLQWWA